jgi:hypothetical protein
MPLPAILALSGSTRQTSVNKAILEFIKTTYAAPEYVFSLPGIRLNNLLWRQIKSNGIMLKMPLMRPITKRLVLRQPAAADTDNLTTTKAIRHPIAIDYLKIPF